MRWRVIIFLVLFLFVLLLLLYFRRPTLDGTREAFKRLDNFISSASEVAPVVVSTVPVVVNTPTVDPLINEQPVEYEESSDEEDPYENEEYLNQRFTRIKEMMPHITQLRREWKEEKAIPGNGRLTLGQFICRRTLELIFHPYKFPEVRPEFLRNPETNVRCELDCYCAELYLAIEFQGYQHRVWPNRFPNMTKEKFIAQCRRDIWKTRICREVEGIELLKVWDDTPYEDIPYDIACMIPTRFDPWRKDIYFVESE